MLNELWFFTSDGKINFGSKPSILASFVVLTRVESEIEFQEKVTDVDLEHLGFSNPQELIQDPDHCSKIRIYIRKKYSSNQKMSFE